jgi:hypothetical protein
MGVPEGWRSAKGTPAVRNGRSMRRRDAYWSSAGTDAGIASDAIFAVPKTGGAVLRLSEDGAGADANAFALDAVDEEFVYWVHGVTGEIVRAPKS